MPSPIALLAAATERIERVDAEALLLHALDCDRAWLFTHGNVPLAAAATESFQALVEQRARGIPVAYLIGRRGFWTLDLMVSQATLIPRTETETLVEQALQQLDHASERRVADLGTGSGAIALAIASERPQAQVLATDTSAAALDIAARNASAHGLNHVVFRQGDWYEALLGERFDLIVSNPPYIAATDPHLTQGDLRFEPSSALISGGDGLDALRILAAGAPAHLRAGGWLVLEHGWDQGAAMRTLLHTAKLVAVATVQDLEARDRVTVGRCPGF
ncbi:peptide chain release factor N(5)-glutamine methyltransferase [Xylella fastidiosa subsp. sandyi]|uniref:peptide chain release factor N(5)-glutamine methyltransferase n=1 Tax=Xylella fastidiosa TaxID=2371 RepID=UPI000FFE4193|nr:peptide chain release factor N(5)-glutamine methyltransferase [Xylella fastidiosa]RWA45197.1 peptide chain release factor N(5)-glutamine methyltransferase [Xylella fastidiosa subsp. sandyi]